MSKLVSIIIPAYNAERFISDAIRSACAQTWPAKEVIVVDDGSLDNTFQVAKKFESSQVKLIQQQNAGAAAARNLAFKHCQGEYIQWLDADDVLNKTKVENQMNRAASVGPDVLLLGAWGRFYFRTCKARFHPNALWATSSPLEWLIKRLDEQLYIVPIAWLASREIVNRAGAWNEKLSYDDDGEYFGRIVLASKGIDYVPESLAYYRISGFGSLSNSFRSSKRLESLLLSHELQLEALLEHENSSRMKVAFLKYLQFFYGCYYPESLELAERALHLAQSIGGSLEPPQLPSKYNWLRLLTGSYVFAKNAQNSVASVKLGIGRTWDHLMYKMESEFI